MSNAWNREPKKIKKKRTFLSKEEWEKKQNEDEKEKGDKLTTIQIFCKYCHLKVEASLMNGIYHICRKDSRVKLTHYLKFCGKELSYFTWRHAAAKIEPHNCQPEDIFDFGKCSHCKGYFHGGLLGKKSIMFH